MRAPSRSASEAPRLEAHRLENRVRRCREALGLSQVELARRVGVARQTLVAVEAGDRAPSLPVALALAAALSRSVEALFAPAEPPAEPAHLRGLAREGDRVRLVETPAGLVAVPLHPEQAADTAADGRVEQLDGEQASVRRFQPASAQAPLRLAGCAPALGLWARRAQQAGLPVEWWPCGSGEARALLREGLVDVAGVHGQAAPAPLPEATAFRAFHWELALVSASDDRHHLRALIQLCDRPDLRFAHREGGTGVAARVAEVLARANRSVATLPAGPLVGSHDAVCRAVAWGAADAGVATVASARALALTHQPLLEEPFDLWLHPEALGPRWDRAFDLFNSGAVRRELACMALDTREAGTASPALSH